MTVSVPALVSLLFLALAYRYYSKYLSRRSFYNSTPATNAPSHELADGVDFVPTKKHVLFGHHFSSVSGAAPILGPAIAIIWGWIPALIWVVFGSIFIGAVHDYGSLILSYFFKGQSIGSITGDILGKRSRFLFLSVIFLLVFIVIAVFAFIIATLFVQYPGSVIPINFEILVAIYIGRVVQRKKTGLLIPSLIALILLYGTIYIGYLYPVVIPGWLHVGGSPVLTWVIFLMIYGFVASVLPVTVLLQPRDYINSHQLILGLILVYIGLFISNPVIDAPMVNTKAEVDWFPYLFITIACGAISGFHALVSTGTTVKQLDRIEDARSIGYGSMLGEASLAIAATLAVASGFDGPEHWASHYASYHGADGLGSKLHAFVLGTSSFIQPIVSWFGEDEGAIASLSAVFISVLVISFAATSLDTAVRIQRYVLGEIAVATGFKKADNRYLLSFIAVLLSMLLVLTSGSGTGGLILWPLFGTTNQLLGALTLMVLTIWLRSVGRNHWVTLYPLIFLLTIVTIAAFYSLLEYVHARNWLLSMIASGIMICHLWLLLEGWKLIRKQPDNPGH